MINRKTRDIIRKFVPNYFINLMMKYQEMYNVVREFGGRHSRQCPGFFFAYGQPLEHDAVCPGCRSIGRHRQHNLIIERHGEWIDNKAVLHFAPEPAFVDAYARNLALTMWLQAAWLMATHKNGMSARQMREQLGLGSYKSAWLLCAKLRRAMVAPERNPLTGRSRRDHRFVPDQGRPADGWAGT